MLLVFLCCLWRIPSNLITSRRGAESFAHTMRTITGLQRNYVERLVLEKGEVFDDSDVTPKRLYTVVVCKDDEGFFIAQLNCSMSEVPRTLVNAGKLNGIHVSPSEVFPPWHDGVFTLAHECASSQCYLKQPSLVFFRRGDESEKNLILHEAHVMEELKNSQHPNIVIYHGCVREKDRIIGLCLEKYSETLSDRVRRQETTLDIDKCVQGIHSGIVHIHSLGYCHNDINPRNIMFKSKCDEIPIIIDFDSCIRKGDPMGTKVGTPDFSNEHATHSLPENDFYSLQLVEKFIRETRKACIPNLTTDD